MKPLHFDSLARLLRRCNEFHTTASAGLNTLLGDERIKLLPQLMAMTPAGQEPMQMVLAEQARYLMGELQGKPGSTDLQRRLKKVLDVFRANQQRITAGEKLLQRSPSAAELEPAVRGARIVGLSVLEAQLQQAMQRSTSATASAVEAKEIEIFKTWPENDGVKRSLQNDGNLTKAIRPQLGLTANDIKELQSWPSPYFTGLNTPEDYVKAYKDIKNIIKNQKIPNFTMREVVSMFVHSQKNGRLSVNMAIARAAALRREINKSPMANRMSFESFKDLYASSSKNLFKQGASPKEVVQVVESQLKALDEYHPGGNLSLLQREAESLKHDSPVIQAAKNMEETKQEAVKLGVSLFQLNQMNEERIRDGKSPQRIAKEYSIIQELNNISMKESEYDDEYEEIQFAIKYFELRRSVPSHFPSQLNINDPKIIETIIKEARKYEYFLDEVDEMYENDGTGYELNNIIKYFDPALSVEQCIVAFREDKDKKDFTEAVASHFDLHNEMPTEWTLDRWLNERYDPKLSVNENISLLSTFLNISRFKLNKPEADLFKYLGYQLLEASSVSELNYSNFGHYLNSAPGSFNIALYQNYVVLGKTSSDDSRQFAKAKSWVQIADQGEMMVDRYAISVLDEGANPIYIKLPNQDEWISAAELGARQSPQRDSDPSRQYQISPEYAGLGGRHFTAGVPEKTQVRIPGMAGNPDVVFTLP